jgi:FMN phosphatase YigB (HAD superfamily)
VVEHVLQGVRCVVFDVGETLVNESRLWMSIANESRVPFATVCGVLGGLVERGEHHGQLWNVLGVDRVAPQFIIQRSDLYPDALDCIESARQLHLKVGIAGNQPVGLEDTLSAVGVTADFIGSSAAWGISKPHPEFFARIVDIARVPAHAILYVGDRLDNDILPAHRPGMRTAHLRRGTWGYLHARQPERAVADVQVDSLSELTIALRAAV